MQEQSGHSVSMSRTSAVALCITNLFKMCKIIWRVWEVAKEKLTQGKKKIMKDYILILSRTDYFC